MWDIIIHLCPNLYFSKTTVEVVAWMIDYIPLLYMDVITHPCPKRNTVKVSLGLESLYNHKHPLTIYHNQAVMDYPSAVIAYIKV